jgi:hypothetical protein
LIPFQGIILKFCLKWFILVNVSFRIAKQFRFLWGILLKWLVNDIVFYLWSFDKELVLLVTLFLLLTILHYFAYQRLCINLISKISIFIKESLSMKSICYFSYVFLLNQLLILTSTLAFWVILYYLRCLCIILVIIQVLIHVYIVCNT